MSRIAYFQPFSGLSGDMALGALIDAGLDLDRLRTALDGLHLDGYRLESESVLRGAFACTRLQVRVDGDGDPHSHSHSHSHPHRSLSAILAILEASELSPRTRERAAAVFRRLGEAEARVHGVDVEQIHFHEVGAVDSIVDITAFCVALELLEIDAVFSAPVTVGTGFVRGAHGRMPLPAPATLELLRGVPIVHTDSGAELCTPTGAALLSTLCESFGPMPAGRVESIGYGAGDERGGPTANAVRVWLAETSELLASEGASGEATRDVVVQLETNVDDMSAEWLGWLVDRLLEVGALDVWISPILMKKSRPAHQLSVLSSIDKESRVAEELFRESTTFGVRRQLVERHVLERRVREVPTPWGPVRVKSGSLGGRAISAAPEFDDLRRVARRSGRPLKEVHRLVLESFHAEPGGDPA